MLSCLWQQCFLHWFVNIWYWDWHKHDYPTIASSRQKHILILCLLQVYRQQNTVLPLLSNVIDAREGSNYRPDDTRAKLMTLPSLDCSPMTSMDLNNLLDFSRPLLTAPSLETSKGFDNGRVFQVRLSDQELHDLVSSNLFHWLLSFKVRINLSLHEAWTV